MIKTILMGVACFVVALAASTSVMVMRTPVKGAVKDSTAVADSLVHATAAHEAAPAAGQSYAPAGDFAADAPVSAPDLIQLAQAIPHTAEPVAASPKHVEKNDAPADFARVGKILVNMKPAEAAAIMGYLADAQVEGVLRSLGPRQAASMLAALPTERAAQLSKRLLIVPVEVKQP